MKFDNMGEIEGANEYKKSNTMDEIEWAKELEFDNVDEIEYAIIDEIWQYGYNWTWNINEVWWYGWMDWWSHKGPLA